MPKPNLNFRHVGYVDPLRPLERKAAPATTVTSSLPVTGFVRLRSIIGPEGLIPVGKSTWWAGVESGRFPKPVKLGARITVWRAEDIRALIEGPR